MKTVSYITLIFIQLSRVSSFKLTILHTNDVHSRFEETNVNGGLCFDKEAKESLCYGGAARRSTMIKQIRAQEPNVILLDAGDAMTGTLWYNVYRGNATWELMNQLGYDAMALGNHDFDDGPANTARFLRNVNFSVVMSNLDAKKEPLWSGEKPLFMKSKVLEIGGEKIGIVGYVLQSTPSVSNPGPGPNLRFLPEIESVRAATDDLRQKGINKIIAVGHSGIWVDEKLAKQVSGVDVVVGGHSNTFLYSGTPKTKLTPKGPYPMVVQSNDGHKVPVVQAYAYGVYLGRLDVEFDNQGKVTKWSGQPILLDKSVARDTDIQRLVNKMKPEVEKISKVKLGRSLVFLNADRVDCRLNECNLGNLVTDAMVFHYANKTATSTQWTNASIALQNSGSIVASIDVSTTGFILYEYALNSLPYGNTFDMVQLQGADLKSVLEQSVSGYDVTKPKGSFLQVSGLRVQYNLQKPAGQRVISVQTLCTQCREPKYQPLRDTTVYNVIVNSYIADGNGGFSVIKNKRISHKSGSTKDYNVLAEYIKTHSPVLTGREERIQFVQASTSGSQLALRSKPMSFIGAVVIIIIQLFSIYI